MILAATISAAMLVVANVSSLNVALPQLSRALDASQTDVQWMIDIYAVFLAALLLPAGALGDRFGRRGMLLFGIVVLAGANAATLAVDTAMPVIVLRAVSGIGAAFIFPATLSTITATLPDEQRGRGVAMWTAAVGIGGIFGILGSGVLIENYWWGSVFLAMTIVAIVVLGICWAFVPDSSDPEEANLDPLGALLSFAAAGGLVLGVIEGPVKGWTSPMALGSIVVGGVALAGFVYWEWRNPRPLLDVRLFAERGIRSGSLSIFVQFTAAFGFFFLTVPYLAFVLGYGPLKTGLGLLPVALGLFPASAAAIPLTRRFGRRVMGIIGLLILASAFVVGTIITVDSSFMVFAIVMVVFGLGLGLSSPPATEAIVESLPPAKQGVASALNDVLREFGAAIGIAAIGSAFNGGYRATIDDLVGFPDEIREAIRETPAAAAVIAPDLGDAGPSLLANVSEAVIDGWSRGLWLTAIIVAVGAAGYAAWAPRRPTAALPTAVPAPAPVGEPLVEPILVRAMAGARSDLIELEGAVGAVNADAERRIGAHLQLAADTQPADVVVAFMGEPPDLYGLAEVARDHPGHEPPDLLVFVRGEATALLGSLDGQDPASKWLSDRVSKGGAQVIAMDHGQAGQTTMVHTMTRRLDVWADRKDRLDLAPRLDLGGIEIVEPLGAIEIAGAAEADLSRLKTVYNELAHTIDLLTARSAVPPDMDSWPAAQQTIVTERAALAMTGPLRELTEQCERALERTRGCDSLVTGAHTELRRSGRPDYPLDEVRIRATRVIGDAHAAAVALGALADRFEDLAALRSTLRPAAEQLRSAADFVDRGHRIALTWVRHAEPLDPGRTLDATFAESGPARSRPTPEYAP